MKLPGLQEDICEQYGQFIVYNGGIEGAEFAFDLDDHHHFEVGQGNAVCGNSCAMVQNTRFAKYFTVYGDRSTHYGPFEGCGGDAEDSGLAGVNGNIIAGLAVEAVFTCLFVLVVLGATEAKYRHGSAAGLVIAFSLSAVIFGGIALSSASYNPARSLGPAIVAAFAGDLSGLASVWVFIVGPLVGGALAAFLFNWLSKEDVTKVEE